MKRSPCSACHKPLTTDDALVWWTGRLAIEFCETCAADPVLVKATSDRVNRRFDDA